LNLPPTLTEFNLSSDTIYQGQSVSASLDATDPGADSINFFVNGNFVGTDPNTSGIRSVGTNLGTFTDVGDYTFTGLSQDKDGAFSNPLIRTLKVLNVAPTITQLTENLIVKQKELFDFAAAATDPGIHDLLTFDWDFNMDGIFDFTSSSGQWSFGEPGTYKVGLRVSDDKGGYTSSSFTVEVERVPEPGSVLGVLAFGAFGAGAVLKRKQQQIGKNNSLN
jgi:chitodextrinase